MKKRIYVGCYDNSIKRTGPSSFTYSYLPITVFIERARREGLVVYSYQASDYPMMMCSHVYEITFRYKFKDRKLFRKSLTELEIQPIIVKWFRIQERVD